MRHSIHMPAVDVPRCAWYARGKKGIPAPSIAGFSKGPADAPQAGLPHLFPDESDHVASDDDPMMASMAGRYAVALFELAKDQKQLEQVERDLGTFQAMIDGSADLRIRGRRYIFGEEIYQPSVALQDSQHLHCAICGLSRRSRWRR